MEGTIQFPFVIDSTMLNSWRACEQQCYYAHFRNLKLKGINIDLWAGGAFARGLEATRRAFYEQGLDSESSINIGIQALTIAYGDPVYTKDSPKTWPAMVSALVAYFDEYPLETSAIQPTCYSGKYAIEFSFAIPLDMWGFFHPETGDPLILAGRSDMIGSFRGSDFVVDEKTTTQLGPTWSNKWSLRAQFMCYMWAARLYGFSVAGTIVRGVAIRKSGGTDFAEAIVRRNDMLIDRWVWQTKRTIAEMLEAWGNSSLPITAEQTSSLTDGFTYSLGEACESYGGCPFKQLCLAVDVEAHIRTDYEINTWSPLVGS